MKKIITTAAVLAVAGAANADFSGYYAPAGWTEVTPYDSAIIWNAPGGVTVQGVDSGTWYGSFTTLTIVAPANGLFQFDWYYYTTDSPGYDEGGYIINNTYYYLDGYGGGSGTVSVNVNAGDTIGWYVNDYDGCCGAGFLEVTNFTGPIPAPGALALIGLAGLTARRRRR
ncbi:MAG: hypothetical protein JSV91_05585 [Phycisphaerales bacterium]|nr:MAG: hypothetical protein JSV91_05585 [Phycisphaerales bacterium]